MVVSGIDSDGNQSNSSLPSQSRSPDAPPQASQSGTADFMVGIATQ